MKKTLSILLTILMVFSVMSVAVSAFDAAYEIRINETITVSAPVYDSGRFTYIKFVPEKDGKFVLESNAGEEIDPICELNDSEMEYLASNDDCHGMNFCMEYDFIAGETYYFAVAVYSQEADVDVTLVCGHTYDDGICITCGNECDHSEMVDLGYCPCGDVFLGVDIADGDELEHDDAAFNNEAGWYRFVPEESGVFFLESFTDPDEAGDSVCMLYDENGKWLHVNDDHDESFDFKLIFNFEAGETYYFEVRSYYEDAVFTLKLNRATHTADDGSEHNVEFVAETESNCIEHGYTEGLYCPDCDEYVWGHEEKELSLIHNDFDWDDICDDCGEEIVYDEEPDDGTADNLCDHCGKSHDNIIYRIFCFFTQFFLNLFRFFGYWE